MRGLCSSRALQPGQRLVAEVLRLLCGPFLGSRGSLPPTGLGAFLEKSAHNRVFMFVQCVWQTALSPAFPSCRGLLVLCPGQGQLPRNDRRRRPYGSCFQRYSEVFSLLQFQQITYVFLN